jgi:hypothetical protein
MEAKAVSPMVDAAINHHGDGERVVQKHYCKS